MMSCQPPSSNNSARNMSKKYTSTVNELVAGSVGGAAQVLVGQPLDTIKTRAQIAPSASSSSTSYDHLLNLRITRTEGMFVSSWSKFPLSTPFVSVPLERSHGYSRSNHPKRRIFCPLQRYVDKYFLAIGRLCDALL